MNIMSDNNKKMKTTLRIVGEINIDTLKTFFDETDEIIEEYGKFQSESVLVKKEYLQKFPPITIELSSYGGCTDCGSAIIHRMDEMKEMGIEVNTHCHFAYSMAFIIYVNGVKRTGDKLSKFMNHGSASYNRGYVEEQRSSIEFSTKSDEQFEKIIYDNTKMPKERVERARLCYDWIDYEEAKELGIINYYKGCEKEVEEEMNKVSDALESAIDVFSQLLGMEKEDGFDLMIELLAPIYEDVEEVKDKVEDKKEDKDEMDEYGSVPLMKLEEYVMEEVREELKDIRNLETDGCPCGDWVINIEDLGYLTFSSSCRKSGLCPEGKEWHLEERVFICDKDIHFEDGDEVEIIFEIEEKQAMEIVELAYETMRKAYGYDEFGKELEDEDIEIIDDEEDKDENKLAKTLGEILNKAMDEEE